MAHRPKLDLRIGERTSAFVGIGLRRDFHRSRWRSITWAGARYSSIVRSKREAGCADVVKSTHRSRTYSAQGRFTGIANVLDKRSVDGNDPERGFPFDTQFREGIMRGHGAPLLTLPRGCVVLEVTDAEHGRRTFNFGQGQPRWPSRWNQLLGEGA